MTFNVAENLLLQDPEELPVELGFTPVWQDNAKNLPDGRPRNGIANDVLVNTQMWKQSRHAPRIKA